MSEFSTKFFTVDKQHKMFIAEMSDLQGDSYHSINHQLYPDACDVGIELISQNTGAETTWYVDYEIRSQDEDNELQVTVYAPTNETICENRQLTGWSIHILND